MWMSLWQSFIGHKIILQNLGRFCKIASFGGLEFMGRGGILLLALTKSSKSFLEILRSRIEGGFTFLRVRFCGFLRVRFCGFWILDSVSLDF